MVRKYFEGKLKIFLSLGDTVQKCYSGVILEHVKSRLNYNKKRCFLRECWLYSFFLHIFLRSRLFFLVSYGVAQGEE